jgi:indole-3-glycerol phosphate synthase
VAESGIRDAATIATLQGLGYRAFLIGERFMTAGDPGAALKELL